MSPTVYSKKYPPRNRVDTGLGPLQIEIVDNCSTLSLDPNLAIVVAMQKKLPLAGPVGPSMLSGEPGYRYRTCEVDLVLTRDEMLRLLRRELLGAEVQKLLETFGAFFEIHADFYDEDTFLELQPLG